MLSVRPLCVLVEFEMREFVSFIVDVHVWYTYIHMVVGTAIEHTVVYMYHVLVFWDIWEASLMVYGHPHTCACTVCLLF